MSIINKLKVVSWNIGFIDTDISDIMNACNYRISWMKHAFRDRFFADPFLLSANSQYYYILAEEYLFIEGKGKIVKLKVNKKSKELIERTLLIETDFHMSYPFIYNNHIYPESSASGNWIRYDIDGNNPIVLSGIAFIDGTIFYDGKQEWLFATKIEASKADACRNLYRYKMVNGYPDTDTEKLLKKDIIASRPGGQFFKWNNDWYRVAQTSSDKVYGERIDICKMITCSDSEYKEEFVMTISSKNEKRYNMGLHTFNTYKSVIIVDGFEMQTHPFLKIIAKIKG